MTRPRSRTSPSTPTPMARKAAATALPTIRTSAPGSSACRRYPASWRWTLFVILADFVGEDGGADGDRDDDRADSDSDPAQGGDARATAARRLVRRRNPKPID